MKESIDRAKKILKDWKGDSYTFGEDILEAVGKYARKTERGRPSLSPNWVRSGMRNRLRE